jgi:hypothetical protein
MMGCDNDGLWQWWVVTIICCDNDGLWQYCVGKMIGCDNNDVVTVIGCYGLWQ